MAAREHPELFLRLVVLAVAVLLAVGMGLEERFNKHAPLRSHLAPVVAVLLEKALMVPYRLGVRTFPELPQVDMEMVVAEPFQEGLVPPAVQDQQV
jgi:hypothetical protein